MKHVVFSPLGKCLSIVPIALVIFGCASTINHEAYAVNNEKTEPIINVTRDNQSGSENAQKCNTNFYINGTKVGDFAIKDTSNYQLVSGQHSFSVDNCQGMDSKHSIDFEIKQNEAQKFTLSADSDGKPFIIIN